VLATVPIGYGDGISRALTDNADLLVRGRRFPLVGTVSMDNIALDLGPDAGGVERGDAALLIGAGLPAEEMARRLGTINYEVTCTLTARVPRRHHRDGVAL
jgi:alanine racemase